jgi:hypothetical protein
MAAISDGFIFAAIIILLPPGILLYLMSSAVTSVLNFFLATRPEESNELDHGMTVEEEYE